MTKTTEQTILACGHPPSPHSEHTTGTVYIDELGEVCWECGNRWESKKLANDATSRWSGYMKLDKTTGQWTVTNWVNYPLGQLHNVHSHRGNFGSTVYTFRATIQGKPWYGRGTGNGMLCHLYRSKH